MRFSGITAAAVFASIGMMGAVWLLPEADAADPVVGTGDGLRGYYFARNDFMRLHTVRLDPTVNFNWGTGAPVPGMPPDFFSVRWTGEVQSQYAESYTFSASADDWANVYIDGVLANGPIPFAAGEKKGIRVEFAEGSSYSHAILRWQSASTPLQTIPTSQLYATPLAAPVVGSGTGLLGYYYDDSDFTRLFGTRVDTSSTIDFSTAAPISGMGADHFAARWIGRVQAQYSEDYHFWVSGDDWISLWVNGERIANGVVSETRVGPVTMVAGETYDIKIEMAEVTSYSHANVRWESRSTPYGNIPLTQMIPAAEPTKIVGTGDGLRAYLYDQNDFTRFFQTRIDATLDQNYVTGAPAAGMGADLFAVRWLGELEPQLSEGYRFYVSGDDWASLWVNDQLVLSGVSGETRTAPIPLVAGQKVDIKLEMAEGASYANVRVRWESANTTYQDIPTTQLYSAAAPAPIVGNGDGLRGLYYDASDFTRLFAARIDPVIDLNWGTGAPIAGMGADGFAVRWHGHLEPTQNESYRFYASGDDWVSIWLNGAKILDSVSGETRTAPIPLAVGTRYSIMVETAEGSSYAHARLRWESPNTTLQVVPQSQLYALPAPAPALGDGDGLLAQYFGTSSFTNLAVTRVDPTVNFNWATGSPVAGVGPDHFSTRWTGQLLAPYSESYRFYLSADDWASLWIDGVQRLSGVSGETRTALIPLQAGTWHDIRVDMAEGTSYAHTILKWESGNQTLGVIPQAYLSSGGFSFDRNATAIRERAGQLVADVVLAPAQPIATSVSYETFALTANEGSDYGGVSGTLTFAAGETRKTILVPVMDDGVDEANETFRLLLSNPVGLHLKRPMMNVTILDETPPVTAGLLQGLLGDDGWFVSPVQVTLTSQSESAVTIFYRLDAALPFSTYTGPVTVSAEGSSRFEYYAIDDIGVEEVKKNATFQVDLSTPVTSAALSGTEGNGGWWISDVTATVSATDAYSGVATTLARLDDTPLAPYTAPFVATGTGVHTVLMQSSDLAGLVETPVELSFRIDVTPPASSASVTGTGANGWFRGPATVTLSATDADSGSPSIAAAMGPGALAPYTGPLVLSDEGVVDVRFAATDLAGILEGIRTTTVRIDLTAPAVSATVQGDLVNGWYRPTPGNTAVRVALSGTDALSGVSAFQWMSPTLTNGAVASVSGSTISLTTDGTHVIYVRALDLAGNIAPWVEIGPISIDTHAPVLSRVIDATPGNNGWYRDTDATVSFGASDGALGSGITSLLVRVDGGAWIAYQEPVMVVGEGEHLVEAIATDLVGLTKELDVPLRLDATAPLFSIDLDGFAREEDGTYSTSVAVTLNASDLLGAVGVSHNVPGVPAGARTFTVSADGVHSIVATATDAAGNAITRSASFEIRHDVTAPVTTSNAPTGWVRQPTTVRISATDSESPVATTTYTLDGITLVQPGNGLRTRAFNVPVAGNGAHTLTFWSEDVAGNAEEPRTVSFSIDTLAPTTVIQATGSAIATLNGVAAYADGVDVTLTATDAGPSGLLRTEYRIGTSGAWTTYAPGEAIRFATNGAHTIFARSFDVAGNVEGQKSLTIGVDAAAPTLAAPGIAQPVASLMPDGTPVFGGEITITLDASDLPIVAGANAPLAIEWRFGSSAWKPYNAPIQVTTEGRFTLHARVTDLAGHEGLLSYVFLVDLTTPVFELELEHAGDLLEVDGVFYLDADLCIKVPVIDLPLVQDPDAEPIASGVRSVSWWIANAGDDIVYQGNIGIVDPIEFYNATIDLGCFHFDDEGGYKMQWGGCDAADHCRRWGGIPWERFFYGEGDWFHFGYDRTGPGTVIVWPPPNSVSADGYTLPILPSEEECSEAYRRVPNEALAVICDLFVTGDGALSTVAPELRNELRSMTLLAGQVPILVRAFDDGVGVATVDLYVNGTFLGEANATDERGYYVFLANTTALVQDGLLLETMPVIAFAADKLDNVGLDARAMTFVALDPETEALPPLDIGLEAPEGAIAVVPVADRKVL